MSMLAERKRKQKWSLNPRGKDWSQDSNKFGQKMLEKMGWQQGKGLGPKEDGIVEHIKVSYKNDNKGMGYKDRNDQWTEHESNFSALLEALSADSVKPKEIKVNSLEKQSKLSRARVHYHKFTRSKDLSRYSEKDLASIIGRKSFKEDNVESKQEVIELKQESNSQLFVREVSIKDYFKHKLFGFRNDEVANDVLKKEEELDSCTKFPTTGFGYQNSAVSGLSNMKPTKSTFVSYLIGQDKVEYENTDKDILPKKKVKKNHVKKSFGDIDVCSSPNKETKKDNLGLVNPAFNPLATPIKIQKHILEPIKEGNYEEKDLDLTNGIEVDLNINNESFNCDETKLKKRKKQKNISDEATPKKKQRVEEIANYVEVNKDDVNKNKKKFSDLDNPIFNCIEEESRKTLEIPQNPYEVKIKKKKGIYIEEAPTLEENSYELKVKKKIKKNKKVLTYALENPNFTEENDESISEETENIYELKRKKKDKLKNKSLAKEKGIINPALSLNDLSCTSDDIEMDYKNSGETRLKKKNKSKIKNQIEGKGITNPALNLSNSSSILERENNKISNAKDSESGINNLADTSTHNSIIEQDELILNIVTTPVIKKIKEKPDGYRTPVVTSNSLRRKSVRFGDIKQEIIIPNNDIKEMYAKANCQGIDNICFDKQRNQLDENVQIITNTLDTCQAEVENDMNEEKLNNFSIEDVMIGEVGNPHGEHEKLADGSTKLKFQKAFFTSGNKRYEIGTTVPKKSYAHLIKGNIVVGFKHTNLHSIKGYAVKNS